MIIIRHAWLNLKRNRLVHLKMGSIVLLILLIVFSMVKSYQLADDYLSAYQEQTKTVINGVQDLNQNGQAAKVPLTDYEKLKNLSYVKKSQFIRQDMVNSTLALPMEPNHIGSVASFPLDQNNGNILSLAMLDNDSLKELLTREKEQLRGKLPLAKATCVISRALAKANKLKLNDTIRLGAKGQEHAVKIVGIAKLSSSEMRSNDSHLLINWETEAALQGGIKQSFSTVIFQLTNKEDVKKFVKDFKKTESFKGYSLSNQSWAQGLLQPFKGTVDLLFNGAIVMVILGLALITAVFYQSIKKRRDFSTLYMMGMNQRTLVLSGAIENAVCLLGTGMIAALLSYQISRWITGEWLIKLQRTFEEQEPAVNWLLPHFDPGSLALDNWLAYLRVAFVLISLCIMLLLIYLRIANILRNPLQEVSDND